MTRKLSKISKIETVIITKGESCFDAAHIKLVAEVEELGESSRLLADKVKISSLKTRRQGDKVNVSTF